MPTDRILNSARALAFILSIGLSIGTAAQAQPNCTGAALIDQTLPAGGRWQFCWQEHTQHGIVLSDIYYQAPGELARRVLSEATLAQVHIDYDDNRNSRHIVTENGLGDGNLASLDAASCDGTTLGNASRDLLCAKVVTRRPSYKYYSSVETGYALEVHSISRVDNHSWFIHWSFFDDGTIVPAVMLAGELLETSQPASGWQVGDAGGSFVSTLQTFVWRLDFAIGALEGDDRVEEFTVQPSSDGYRKSLAVNTLVSEQARSFDARLKRSWRILDSSTFNSAGRPASYHLEPLEIAHSASPSSNQPWANADVFLTADQACERFGSQNDTVSGCAENITGFLDDEPLNGADIVLWLALSTHHVPSDEDQNAVSGERLGFVLLPRDWTATNTHASVRFHGGEQ